MDDFLAILLKIFTGVLITTCSTVKGCFDICVEIGVKKAICLTVPILLLAGCATSSPYLSMQPQIYKPSGYTLSVTRPGMATSTDTTRVAEQYCSQFGRKASLTKLANPFIVPVRDDFICEENTEEP